MAKPAKNRKAKSRHHQSLYRPRKFPLRFARHAHTGRRLPFYCTSYAVLFFLLTFTTTLALYISRTADAEQQSSSVALSGTVKGPPPELPAQFAKPPNNTHFTQSQIEVAGSCLEDTYVEIYRNNVFAGSAFCNPEGSFSLAITLVPGSNELLARIKDNMDQYGPDSDKITVYLDSTQPPGAVSPGDTQTPAAGNPSPSSSAQPPLLIYATHQDGNVVSVYKGQVDQILTIEYEIKGGTAPFVVSIDWDDGSSISQYRHDRRGTYKAAHVMKLSGRRIINIGVIDARGVTANMQRIAIIEGKNESYILGSLGKPVIPDTALQILLDKIWIPLIIAWLMTASFWLGERLVYNRLAAH